MKYCLLAFLIFFTNGAYTAGYLTSLGSPQATITTVFSHSNGDVTLFVSGIPNNPDECGEITKVHIKATNLGVKNMVSLALTAFASGKKVGFYSSGCEIIPFWGGTTTRPIVSDLWVEN